MIELLDLSANWDSYGARPIELQAIQIGIEVLLSITDEDTPAPAVVPTTGGGVQFEWHRNNCDFEVAVSAAGIVSFFFDDGRNQPVEGEGDLRQLEDTIDRLVSSIR